MDDVAIRVDHVSKTFRLPREKQSSVKGALISLMRGGKGGYNKLEVLKDVSFEVKKGEFFGIVGRNGSGKSTLLKMLAGIYTPTQGGMHVNGRLTPFIELGVGFNPELTGRENVFLNGALLGFNRKEMNAMYDDIVSFAELEKFMDQKLKNYSSGMQVRLAFSIAIRANTEILLLDEVLAVGDAAFQRKCFDYFMQLKRQKRTVILVTHDMNAVREYCDRAVMINDGKVISSGSSEKVAQAYQKFFSQLEVVADESDDRWGDGKIQAVSTDVKVTDKKVTITSVFKAHEALDPPLYGFVMYEDRDHINVVESNTKRLKAKTKRVVAGQSVQVSWSFDNILRSGGYTVSVACCDQSALHYYDWQNNAARFEITKPMQTAGIVDPSVEVTERTDG
ncbi:MAG TPA: ABC transporter ATP-binding protein [Candidatus Saccharimonadales bacterium]|nr:ABC transporter ATP-binding protein [Candidatus Saccharimonadales bacterium]